MSSWRFSSRLMRCVGVVLCAVLSTAASAQALALTFDDGLNPDTEPRAQEWNQRLLAGLQAAAVPAMIFPALSRVGSGAGRRLVEQWSSAGHPVGNHTSLHRNLASGNVTLDDFIQDIQEADAAFRHLPTWRPMLRFPYLKEGDTKAKRDGVRHWMRSHAYKPAPVSVDTSDWYYDEVWLEWARRAPAEKPAELEALQAAYVRHLLDRAQYYDALARILLGRSPPHVMLLHVNALNAAAIGQVVDAFRARGWRFVAPDLAFADPLYAEEPDVLPAGESIVWALARQRGDKNLRYPAEDSVYEEPLLRSQGLLPPAR